MGACESKNNSNSINPQNPSQSKIPEILTKNELYSLDPSIAEAAKSLCKISINNNGLSSGFFIQLFKGEEQFFCLMTNEHVVKREMIVQKQKINILYEFEKKVKEIQLNPEERIIKDFKDNEIDATVIEILPKDNIPQDHFLLPLFDYMGNYNELIGKDISIIQYPQGKMKYSYGKIKYMTQSSQYEFAHDAGTQKGSSGSPIFLKETTRVVGIHKAGNESKDENYGDFIWPIFTYFKNFKENNINIPNDNNFKSQSNNEINIKNVLDIRNNVNVIINNINNNNNKNVFGLIQDNPLEDKLNQMTIIYNIQSNDNSIKLFGNDFVKNNINNCYLLIDGQKIKLCEKLILKNNNYKTYDSYL